MERFVKWHKIIPITWSCPIFPLDNFTLALVAMDIKSTKDN